MNSNQDNQALEWTSELPQADIRELYKQDSVGVAEERALDALGTALLARCKSILTAEDAVRGRAKCPMCNLVIDH